MRGRRGQALSALASALQAAEPERYVRTFVDEGEPVRRLLVALAAGLEDGTVPLDAQDGSRLRPYVATLLSALPGSRQTPRPNGAQASLAEPLSERELEVLRLVAAGHTNREIADRLFIALSTVKSHTNAIYGKLGVKNRTRAIAAAHTLGLL
jgi:LuxR family maltose regulon positive regulatory protein